MQMNTRKTRSSGLLRAFSVALMACAVAACSSNDDDYPVAPANNGSNVPAATALSGSGVKGPLANASITVYALDLAATDNYRGAILGRGETNANAAIVGLSIPATVDTAVLVEVIADSDTIDLTTGAAPVITSLRTLLSPQDLASGSPIFPSVLTTLAYDLALANADANGKGYSGNGDGSVTASELISAFSAASRKVVSTLGFGMANDTNLNLSPPLLTDAVDTTEERNAVAAYRAAIEAVAAIVTNIRANAQVNNSSSSLSNEGVLAALARDLGDDVLDGQLDGSAIEAFADVSDVVAEVTKNPGELLIPGTSIAVTEVEEVLVSETDATGTSSDTTEYENGTAKSDPVAAKTTADSDGDGVGDDSDNCPTLANEDQADFDEDAQGDACDEDRDGDGVSNGEDAFADDPSETLDSDGDGIGNNADPDDDDDNVVDEQDAFPLDSSEQYDYDGDGMGDNADPDDDNDGTADEQDAFPFDENEQSDLDGDGTGDNSDTDRDNDEIVNDADNCPDVANTDQADSDNDGIGDACDDDSAPVQTLWDQFNWDSANWQ